MFMFVLFSTWTISRKSIESEKIVLWQVRFSVPRDNNFFYFPIHTIVMSAN